MFRSSLSPGPGTLSREPPFFDSDLSPSFCPPNLTRHQCSADTGGTPVDRFTPGVDQPLPSLSPLFRSPDPTRVDSGTGLPRQTTPFRRGGFRRTFDTSTRSLGTTVVGRTDGRSPGIPGRHDIPGRLPRGPCVLHRLPEGPYR